MKLEIKTYEELMSLPIEERRSELLKHGLNSSEVGKFTNVSDQWTRKLKVQRKHNFYKNLQFNSEEVMKIVIPEKYWGLREARIVICSGEKEE